MGFQASEIESGSDAVWGVVDTGTNHVVMKDENWSRRDAEAIAAAMSGKLSSEPPLVRELLRAGSSIERARLRPLLEQCEVFVADYRHAIASIPRDDLALAEHMQTAVSVVLAELSRELGKEPCMLEPMNLPPEDDWEDDELPVCGSCGSEISENDDDLCPACGELLDEFAEESD